MRSARCAPARTMASASRWHAVRARRSGPARTTGESGTSATGGYRRTASAWPAARSRPPCRQSSASSRRHSCRSSSPRPRAIGSVEELLRAMSMLGVTRPPLGHTAIALLDADARGDATSHRVIGEVARAIVDVARASAAHVGLAHPSPVVLAGGLFRHANDALERAIAGRHARFRGREGPLRARRRRAAARLRRARHGARPRSTWALVPASGTLSSTPSSSAAAARRRS